MDQVHALRHMVLREGASIRRVARELGLSRNTVRKYLTESAPLRRGYRPRARPVWERAQPRLEELLAEWEPRTAAEQRLTGVRRRRALREEGYQVGLTAIHEYLRERRRQRAAVSVPLIHRAGDEAQADFFEVTVELGGAWVKAWKFLLRLMYSGREFVWLYQRCAADWRFSTATCGPLPIWVGFRAAACTTICLRQCARSRAGSVS